MSSFDISLPIAGDFCNSIALGLPAVYLRRFLVIQHAAASLFFNLRRTEHISDALILQWLRIAERTVPRDYPLQNSVHSSAEECWG